MKVDLFILVIAGFSQKVSDNVGMRKLWWQLRKRFSVSHRNYVMLREWKSDLKGTARTIARDRSIHARVVVCAYSWGCGRGVHVLSKQLAKDGIDIDQLFLVDPVTKRAGPWWRLTQLIALTRWGKFKCPKNVKEVWSWRQVNGPPYGRPVVVTSDQTIQHEQVVFGSQKKLDRYATVVIGSKLRVVSDHMVHSDMDDNKRIHSDILKSAGLFGDEEEKKKQEVVLMDTGGVAHCPVCGEHVTTNEYVRIITAERSLYFCIKHPTESLTAHIPPDVNRMIWTPRSQSGVERQTKIVHKNQDVLEEYARWRNLAARPRVGIAMETE